MRIESCDNCGVVVDTSKLEVIYPDEEGYPWFDSSELDGYKCPVCDFAIFVEK